MRPYIVCRGIACNGIGQTLCDGRGVWRTIVGDGALSWRQVAIVSLAMALMGQRSANSWRKVRHWARSVIQRRNRAACHIECQRGDIESSDALVGGIILSIGSGPEQRVRRARHTVSWRCGWVAPFGRRYMTSCRRNMIVCRSGYDASGYCRNVRNVRRKCLTS